MSPVKRRLLFKVFQLEKENCKKKLKKSATTSNVNMKPNLKQPKHKLAI